MQKFHKTFQQQLQNNILFICNLSILSAMTGLGIMTFIQGTITTTIISIIAIFFLIISIILQQFNYYSIALYITIVILSIASFSVTYSRPIIIPELVYLLISFQMIPLTLTGILAQHKFISITMGFISFSMLSIYIFIIQKSVIGVDHIIPIVGSYVSLIIMIILSNQIYNLTGNIMNRFNEERDISKNKDILLQNIIRVYLENQQSDHQLEVFNIDNDTLAGQLNDHIQKFTSDMHEFNQLLKTTQMRNENLIHSSSNILTVFNNHKENIIEYKNKTQTISDTSQEINLIIQNRKVQMNELIELTEKGGIDMQESIVAIEKVAENSKNVLDMITLIMEVAEKTNILALNAAVEASRAGKYGGGFAIVAKEIKLLSTETTQNADILNQSLQNNLKSITETVEVIKNVGQSFSYLNNNIIDLSTAIDKIVIKITDLTQINYHVSIETKNTLSLISEVQNTLEKTIHSIESSQTKISDITSLSNIFENNVSQLNQTTNAIINSSRTAQKKYREYKYSIKKIEDIIIDIDQQIEK